MLQVVLVFESEDAPPRLRLGLAPHPFSRLPPPNHSAPKDSAGRSISPRSFGPFAGQNGHRLVGHHGVPLGGVALVEALLGLL
eukprot:12381874-Alexandrium_andersonii.AAC.1